MISRSPWERRRTSRSVISRIESGQHSSSLDTLRRLAEALGGHALVGFEFPAERGSSPGSL
ncbi:MAG: helix-turn-helix transcriptional regulator, partial [Acidimicrobiia bacterium]|nr:helix-turn-helix transcriptional regulator [Acidimicrobiia bacterium]